MSSLRFIARLSVALVSACGAGHPAARTPPPPASAPAPAAQQRASACDGALHAAEPEDRELLAHALQDSQGTVVRVRVDAPSEDLRARARRQIRLQKGSRLSDSATSADAQRLWELGGMHDVRVQISGPSEARVVTFELRPAPIVDQLETRGENPLPRQIWDVLGLTRGQPMDPVRLARGLSEARDLLSERGHRDATLGITGVRVGDRLGLCAHVHAGPRSVLAGVRFSGNARLGEEELAAALTSAVGEPMRDEVLERDALALQALYYDRGMVTAHVSQAKLTRKGNDWFVTFEVREGPVFRLRKLDVRGELAAPRAAYLRRLQLKPGDVFSRSKVAADLERLRALHEEHKASDLDILPETTLDEASSSLDLILVVRRAGALPH